MAAEQQKTADELAAQADAANAQAASENAAPPQVSKAADIDGGSEKFPLSRILDPGPKGDGAQITGHEWHNIAGAFAEELAQIRKDAKAAEQEITRSQAIQRIEKYLRHEEIHA